MEGQERVYNLLEVTQLVPDLHPGSGSSFPGPQGSKGAGERLWLHRPLTAGPLSSPAPTILSPGLPGAGVGPLLVLPQQSGEVRGKSWPGPR